METTNTLTTETKANGKTEAELIAKRKAQQAQLEKAASEANAFRDKLNALLKEGAELGSLALDALAAQLGASASKAGRPTESAFLAFNSAVAHRKLSYDRRADLARKANAAVREEHKPVAKITSKANASQGSQSYRINSPVTLAENIGAE